MKHLFLLILFIFLTGPVYAAPYVYEPDSCEFAITFPDEPLQRTSCNPEDENDCSQTVSYTKVFDMNSSLAVRATCTQADEAMYHRYDRDTMVLTLDAVVGDTITGEKQHNFQSLSQTKQAVVMGSGKSGVQDTIIVAQLLIGQNSVLTFRGELIDNTASRSAENTFADILRSISHKSWTEDEKARDGANTAENASAEKVSEEDSGPDEKQNDTETEE